MVFTFRFFNHRKMLVVAKDYDTALSALDISQRGDIKGFTSRKVLVRL